jgi:hypothetical protein
MKEILKTQKASTARIKLLGVGILIVLLSFIMVGCGNDDPSAVVRQALTYSARGDLEGAIQKFHTAESVNNFYANLRGRGASENVVLEAFSKEQMAKQKEWGEPSRIIQKINGNRATVTVTYGHGRTFDYSLIKEKGKWKIMD